MPDRVVSRPTSTDNWTYVLGLFGLGMLVNAVWMLAAPAHWFTNLPARVPDFGPPNAHFIRDLGSAFLVLGGGLIWAAFRPPVRVPVLVLVTGFHVAHALGHVFDTATGRVGPEHWWVDFPLVYAPAIILVVLTIVAMRPARGTP